MNTDNIDDLYCKWYETFREALEFSIPNRIVTIRPRDKPWMSSDIRKAIRKARFRRRAFHEPNLIQ